MFCWQARARFADSLDRPGAPSPAGWDRHVASCARCRAELDALRSVRSLVTEAARLAPPAGDRMDDRLFAQTVLRKARARQAAPAPSFSFVRPIPLGAALSLMIAAVCLVQLLAGVAVPVPAGPQGPGLASSSDLDDSVVPREVPFVVQQDLVGARRGSIPQTTYVLEPAPREKPILRASL